MHAQRNNSGLFDGGTGGGLAATVGDVHNRQNDTAAVNHDHRVGSHFTLLLQLAPWLYTPLPEATPHHVASPQASTHSLIPSHPTHSPRSLGIKYRYMLV